MTKRIILYIALALVSSGSFAQEMYSGSKTMTLSYPVGIAISDFNDFISEPSYRAFSFGFGNFINPNIALGGSFLWNGFYEKKGRQIYEFESGALTATKFDYLYQTTGYAHIHYYPIKDKWIVPYTGLNLGFSYTKKIIEMGTVSSKTDKMGFSMAPELGFIIPAGPYFGFTAYGRYHHTFYKESVMFDISMFTVGAGIVFNR